MDFKRVLSFFVIAFVILFGWEQLFPETQLPPEPSHNAAANQSAANRSIEAPKKEVALAPAIPITVTTDTVRATIDEKTGDLRRLVLLKHNATSDANQEFTLFGDTPEHQYIAQSKLIAPNGQFLLKDQTFKTAQQHYDLGDQPTLEVRLEAPETDGLSVNKIYTFQKGSYVIDVRFEVKNHTDKPVQLDAAYRILRDANEPDGTGYFDHTYHGPVLFTPEGKFEKVPFGDLDRNKAEYVHNTTSGWVGMSQHYFVSAWILQPKKGASICHGTCQIDIRKRQDGLYSAGARVALPAVEPGKTVALTTELYAGPQEYSVISQVADEFQLVKDYGKVHIFAAPLFWLLNKLHSLVGNWGWAIILLTLLVKAVFYPLTAASYRSMAKMRAVAPKLATLKAEMGDDRMKMQQAMMELYKKEKINPLGGCLPMLIQIPVFIGLYWALFSSVELRQAPWIGWISDLGRKDPYYILPILMALTMFVQTHLNPPPSDPLQAKMMKIMPLAFSIMFFFFPAGLVLYWLSNNVLSIAQQWYVNKTIAAGNKKHKR